MLEFFIRPKLFSTPDTEYEDFRANGSSASFSGINIS